MLPSEDESQDDPIRLYHYEQDRVLRYSDISNFTIDACTIEDPGLIDISSEDPGNDIQQERPTLSRGTVQLLKEDSALNKEVMDKEKQFKSKNRKTNLSDTNKKKIVDFKNNTGLIGMKISQRDVIVDDVPDINQNANTTKIKNKVGDTSSVKGVPERDVYERIIGKAYYNIKNAGTANSLSSNSNADLKNASKSANNTSKGSTQTCHKPLKEVSVYKLIDSKRPKKVCRSKSLYIPSVQKTIESEKNVGKTSKTRNITKEVNFKGLDDNNLHYSNITTKELTRNQNLKTHSRDKSKSMMIHEMSTPSTHAAKSEDAKITAQCGNVNIKPLIHNRKNVNINHDHVSSEGSKIIKPTDTKKICKSTDDQVINQVAPKVAASISKNRRNTISSAGQITKSSNSEKVTKVQRKNVVPNYNDHITKLNLFDKMTKPATCDARYMILKNDNLNCNNQLKIVKDAPVTKLINNEKAFEQTKDKIDAISNKKINRHITTSSVDANNKPGHNQKPVDMKRKVINIIDDQVLTSFVPKVAASISNKRRNTVSSICPENTPSLKVCSKSFFSDDKIIPHYHTRLLGNKTGKKDKNDKTDAATKTILVKLTQDKSPLEVNPEKNPETRTERNENNYKPCKDDNNTAPLSQTKPSEPAVIINKNNIVIEPTEPNINLSLNAPPTVLPQQFPKFDPTINANISNTLNIPDRLHTEKNTEHFLRKIDSVPCKTIPVLLNMAPNPNQRSYENFSSTFPIQSVVCNRPLQEFNTNICLSPRTAYPRSHRIRPWQAPYPSNYNQFNGIPNNQYPIFNRLMNASTFVRNSYISRTVTPPPKFQHSPRPNPPYPPRPPYRPNSPCLPINISNTSPKDKHQGVNIKDRKETSSSKIKNPSNEAPAVEITLNGKEINSSVKNANISKTGDIPPVKRSLTENINILNNTKETTHREQKPKVKDCNEAKNPPEKTYSPAILPILPFPEICDILLETSGYDYPNLKKAADNRTEWLIKDAFDRSDLDKKKRKMNDESTPDKKGKISLSEYKKRLAVATTS